MPKRKIKFLAATGLAVSCFFTPNLAHSVSKEELRSKCNFTLKKALTNLREKKDKETALALFLEAAEIGKKLPLEECRENALLNAIRTQISLKKYSAALKTATEGIVLTKGDKALYPLFHSCLFHYFQAHSYEGLAQKKDAERSESEFQKLFKKLTNKFDDLPEISKSNIRWKMNRLDDIAKISEMTGIKFNSEKYSKEFKRLKTRLEEVAR